MQDFTNGVKAVILNRRRWRVLFTSAYIPPDEDGLCDDPSTKKRAFRVRPSLRGVRLIDILIHEMMHAWNWDIADDIVANTAYHASHILTELGWVRFPDHNTGREERLAKVLAHIFRIMDGSREHDTWSEPMARDIARALWRLGFRQDLS